MKTNIKRVLIWLGLSILMMVLWVVGLMVGNAIFPSGLLDMAPNSSSNAGPMLLFLTCALNTGVILYFIHHARVKGWRLVGIVFLFTFGIQYFMSQIETLWFNDSIDLPINGIWAIITGGAVMILLFSVAAAWITGNFNISGELVSRPIKRDLWPIAKRMVLLSVVVWPLIYFLAGYCIAWQFAEVRLLYSDTSEMAPFLSIMEANIASGLYFFQIARGIFWILIALPVLAATNGSLIHKGIILGLLFAILGSSGLLIPNPVMSDMVRMAHLLETAPSDFIWGFIIAWNFGRFTLSKPNQIRLDKNTSLNQPATIS